MKITLTFRDPDARAIAYYLKRRYNSKAELANLALIAIRREVADEAKKELAELNTA